MSETGAVNCRCGAARHPVNEDRCAAGHLLPGNLTAAVVGQRGVTFWREHAALRREIRESVIRDCGQDPEEAPRALVLAADGVAQAALVRDSAYERMLEAGGPLTSGGRTRRAFEVWCKALDRLERHLRMVGIKRAPKRVQTLSEVIEGTRRGFASGGGE